MRSLLHSGGEGVFVKAHSDGCHLSGQETGIDHLETPVVHLFLPLWEVCWVHLWNVVLYFGRSFANLPEKAPFGVWQRWVTRDWLVGIIQ